MFSKKSLSASMLALVFALFLAAVFNVPLWRFVAAEQSWGFALRCFFIVAAFYAAVLGVFALPRIQKPVIGILLFISAAVSYFIKKYGIFIDVDMVRNAMQTDQAEARDLMGASFFGWMFVFCVIPAAVLWFMRPVYQGFGAKSALRYAALPALSAALMLGLVWSGLQELAPFYRNHREVRHMIVPYNALAATIKYTRTDILPSAPKAPHVSSPASLRPRADDSARQVVVFVVGETARAANFSLGGYGRATNPALQSRNDIIYFDQFTSCGTHTAYSLPCMFSSLNRKEFNLDKFDQNDDLIHLMSNAGVQTIWVDNNSGCKGVCDSREMMREDALAKSYPQYCKQGECYDGVLVAALKDALKRSGDLFIVLHQKGSHGPLYHKRVPGEFARFQPVCAQSDLSKCSSETIVNAYDNTILYTDHVLNAVIDALKGEQQASMFYASDHGESLGEGGLYLHGAPYVIAPSEQTHIPAVLWMSQGDIANQHVDQRCLRDQASMSLSHDNIFPTLLDLQQVETKALKRDMSLLNSCKHVRSANLLLGKVKPAAQ